MARMATGSLSHPVAAVAFYLFLCGIAMVILGKVDGLGKHLPGGDGPSLPTPTCRVTDQSGSLHVNSPVCTEADMKKVSPTWQRRESEPNDPAFCTPRQPWFWFDLGGTMCVCDKQWDRSAYWSKVLSSFAFNFPHFLTPFQNYLVTQRWLWVFALMMFNEVVEESLIAVTRYWGFTFDPPYDLEPRYDSLIRDVLLFGLSGMLMGMVFVEVMKVPAWWYGPLERSWDADGRNTKRHHLKVVLQVLVLARLPGLFNTDFGANWFYPQQVLLMIAHPCVIAGIYFTNRHDWPAKCADNVHRFHVAWALFCMVLWGCTVYPALDEFYLLYIALSSILVVLLCVWNISRCSGQCSQLLLGLPVEVARMSGNDYQAWVESEADEGQRPQVPGPQGELPLERDLRQKTFSKKQIQDALAMLEGDEVPLWTLREVLLRRNASPPSMPLYFQVDTSDSLLREYHRTLKKRFYTLLSVVVIVGAILFIIWCSDQPFRWQGFMYHRHWCGEASFDDDGNGHIVDGCNQMWDF